VTTYTVFDTLDEIARLSSIDRSHKHFGLYKLLLDKQLLITAYANLLGRYPAELFNPEGASSHLSLDLVSDFRHHHTEVTWRAIGDQSQSVMVTTVEATELLVFIIFCNHSIKSTKISTITTSGARGYLKNDLLTRVMRTARAWLHTNQSYSRSAETIGDACFRSTSRKLPHAFRDNMGANDFKSSWSEQETQSQKGLTDFHKFERPLDIIISQLRDETFQIRPARCEKRPGSNKGNLKSLTISSDPHDIIVVEAVRMLLEAVYEPIFLNCSHGYRPGRSCHSALRTLRLAVRAPFWALTADLDQCIGSFHHHRLIGIIEQHCGDLRFIRLLWKILRAGYMEFRQYTTSWLGVPEGLSPI